MANRKRGFYTVKLGGKNRTLHFSMNFWANFTDEMDLPIEQIGNVFQGGVSISAIRALVYSALLANEQEQGNEIDFTIFTVGAWLEDLDATELEKIVEAMTESKILGNDLNAGIKRNVTKSTKAGK
ncbi:MAG: hypothetical protein Unbinned5855contig1001_34 [Prokaryotic dsDNA virus sp.]|jgi:hypothetical protein|nr:MAG: hypothetical protein Unbinned5855contig1001_34 [Prokaryotic dsDNA virus sp.]|tara:strand:- start:9934 stop:10311 length:378 start_codon:yes stop_codon:yes gene_type:complete